MTPPPSIQIKVNAKGLRAFSGSKLLANISSSERGREKGVFLRLFPESDGSRSLVLFTLKYSLGFDRWESQILSNIRSR